ncbi:MAG: leucine--tRNA ligase [Bacteroides sp.]|nr:leucine--tRNA ligase [Bacteroides sp.]MCM1085286.1 leucine--tRNA ligase [Bacteroides sp.]
MDYDFKKIEAAWRGYWAQNKTFQARNDSEKPKFYVLDMFPYPSGAGLHVGHPLGYIASDIYARYKRLQGYNVLHPMGFDAYGLPAEQYAIQTGQHPAVTTQKNIERYRHQLNLLGFSFDWEREVQTCDPGYYHWTQWVFIRLFHSWYSKKQQKALSDTLLVERLEKEGNAALLEEAACSAHEVFSAQDWAGYDEKKRSDILMNYRLAFLSDTMVNWCPKLGTVLANDEVVNGLSERGGFPVERKLMKQWSLRITAYAQRLLDGLDKLQWSDSLKEMQRNWIGRSVGAEVRFALDGKPGQSLTVFTTRPDTLFGVSFMVLCPEHENIGELTTAEQKAEVEAYVKYAKNRTERERQTEVNKVSGVFTGSYAIHPFTGEKLPVWISEYVLAGYGTGAIMAVAAHDSRDYRFAKHFNLPVKQVVEGGDISTEAYETKDGKLMNSEFLNGLDVKQAIARMVEEIERRGLGRARVNYRLRDAIFSRQRYWGEPFPIYYKDGIPHTLNDDRLPLRLPDIDEYKPTEAGEPPLARAKNWTTPEGYPLETCTMPGFAGSSAYYLRYMDARNNHELVSRQANEYWRQVDLYVGGAEHATGHLIYSRFWNKFLYDLGLVCEDEPYKKLINQGMIQGRSNFAYRLNWTNYRNVVAQDPQAALPDITEAMAQEGKKLVFVSKNIENREKFCDPVHVDIHLTDNDILDTEGFKKWMPDLAAAEFILEDGKYICGAEVEKMSKSMYNVENPDEIVERYGADTLRMYEMFLGPVEQSKPWDTKGIEGVFRFLKKFWRTCFDEDKDSLALEDGTPTADEMRVLHQTIKRITDDTERFSFNTAVSGFMIALNELSDLKCRKKAVFEPFTVLLSPFAPHICEEIWKALGHTESISYATLPVYEEKYTVKNSFNYPVSFNGKMRFNMELLLNLTPAEVEKAVLADAQAQKWLEGKTPKKVIVVPGRIVNVVM